MRFQSCFALLFLATLVGCSLTGPDDLLSDSAELTIRTAQHIYSVEAAKGDFIEVPIVIENTGTSPIYLGMDLGGPVFFVQKRVEGEWVAVYSVAVTLVPEAPRKLEAGEKLASTFWVSDLKDRSSWDVDGEVAGTYRFVVVAALTKVTVPDGGTELLPPERRASEPFEITE